MMIPWHSIVSGAHAPVARTNGAPHSAVEVTDDELRILQRRAEVYAHQAEDASDITQGRNILVCQIGAAACAFDAGAIEQIVPWGQVLLLPSLPEPFLGLMVVRGALTSVAQPGVLLGLRCGDGTDRRIIVLRHGEQRLGLVVDAVRGIRWERDPLKTELSELRPAIRRLIAGFTADRTILLDSGELVAELQRRAPGTPEMRRDWSTPS
jgi:chemotaxis signal transduction protein